MTDQPTQKNPTPPTISMDELLKTVGESVKTVSAAPVTTDNPKDTSGVFLSSDGRTLYKYVLDGETVVFPKPIEEMTEDDLGSLSLSLNNNLMGRLPQDLTVKFKDPQWAGRWVNRSAANGKRVSEAHYLGFVPAKKEDCEWVAHGLDDKDGAIINHDLVLMKIHKAKYFQRLLEHITLAKQRGTSQSYKSVAERATNHSEVEHYLTPQATKEHSGLGPVVHLPTVSR